MSQPAKMEATWNHYFVQTKDEEKKVSLELTLGNSSTEDEKHYKRTLVMIRPVVEPELELVPHVLNSWETNEVSSSLGHLSSPLMGKARGHGAETKFTVEIDGCERNMDTISTDHSSLLVPLFFMSQPAKMEATWFHHFVPTKDEDKKVSLELTLGNSSTRDEKHYKRTLVMIRPVIGPELELLPHVQNSWETNNVSSSLGHLSSPLMGKARGHGAETKFTAEIDGCERNMADTISTDLCLGLASTSGAETAPTRYWKN
ncbi:hypothetical protein NE237_010739 [Protea cynaroides]|uniref:Uncharacterized protein n=1 Tax=Protea cynaroides TaxID=273540 RepID=A0A9Q0L0Y8_9MAGN|nr:hypothetical protein NE237_010739 [Protea cynaroides]